MKKLILLFALSLTLGTLFPQRVLWVKNNASTSTTIPEVLFEKNQLKVLLNNDLKSNITTLDSTTSIARSAGFSKPFVNGIQKNSSSYFCFEDNNNTGVNKLDSSDSILASAYFVNKNSKEPKILNWSDDRIILVDNFMYQEDQTFPRITILDTFLRVDTSFFIPLDNETHSYSDAEIASDGSLFLTGVKNVSDNSLDQYLMRIDNTLQIESSRTFGSVSADWISTKNQGISSFPGGAIISGQSIENGDTNVTLSVVSPDNISFSHQVVSADKPLYTFREGVAYLNDKQTIYLLIKKGENTHLLLFNLDGSIEKTFEMKSELKFNKIKLIDSLLYVFGENSLACIDPYLPYSLGSCLLNEVANFNLENATSLWQPKEYFVSPVGLDIINGSASNKRDTFLPSLNTVCPTVSLIGSIKGCKKDTLCVSVLSQDESKWYQSNRLDSVLARGNKFCFSPRSDINYTVISSYGSSYTFAPEVENDPTCIPDTIPVVYDYVSPNNDGQNDEFFIKNLEFIKPASVLIVNAENEELYKNDNYQNNWIPDLPDGTYLFSVSGKNFDKQGMLVIRR